MSFFYQRITKGQSSMTGTLDEPEGAPEPRFALQSTVNWMHALAIGVQNPPIDKQTAQSRYSSVHRAALSETWAAALR
jgi:hypothetical protein